MIESADDLQRKSQAPFVPTRLDEVASMLNGKAGVRSGDQIDAALLADIRSKHTDRRVELPDG